MALERQIKKSGINLNDVEPHLISQPSDIFLVPPQIDDRNWKGLGNSSNRSDEQRYRAQELLQNTLQDLDSDTVIAFTDGSTFQNPGPCGAAAIIYTDGLDSELNILSKPVSRMGSSYMAELNAIHLATSFATNLPNRVNFTKLHIFSDCQSALRSVQNGATKDCSVVSSILRDTNDLQNRGIEVSASWVCGHASIDSNELADHHAKLAAKQASSSDITTAIPLSLAKSAIKKFFLKKWESNWAQRSSNLEPYIGKCTVGKYRSSGSRLGEIRRNRLRLGHSRLRSNLKKIGLTELDTCPCGEDRETIDHILYHCKGQTNEREELFVAIEKIFSKHNTPSYNRTRIYFWAPMRPPQKNLEKTLSLQFINASRATTSSYKNSCH